MREGNIPKPASWACLLGVCGVLLASIWLPQVSSAPATAPIAVAAAPPANPGDPPATRPIAPAAEPTGEIRLDFRDAPLDDVLEQLSQAAGFVVIKEAPIEGRVTVMSMRAVTPAEAVALLDTVLKSNGFTAVHNGRTLRILARDKAKKGDIPVHFGSDPAGLDSSDELITQVVPLRNVEAIKLREDLKPLIGTEADVTANAGANAIVITDTSSNIKRLLQIINQLDRREGTNSEIRIIQLKNASAAAAARLVLAIFKPEEAPRPPNTPAPPPREGKIPGSGVDQALHGGKVTAAADERTNTVVVAGPIETVKIVENMLKELDANPGSIPAIKSFHLKVADATTVSALLISMFKDDGQGGPVRGPGDQPLRAHVSAVAEARTNTIIVTAPASVITVIESIIKDLENTAGTDANIKSYHLKYADAAATVKVLASVFQEVAAGQGKSTGTLRERINPTADVRTNTVIITGSVEALQEADRIVQELDASPTSGSMMKYFHLKQADAINAAKLIAKFFKPDPLAAASGDRAPRGVTADADDRSNTVIVSAPPDEMKIVEDLVKEIETDPLTSLDIQSFKLTFGDATSIAKLITAMFQPDAQQAAAAPTQGRPQPLRAKVIANPDDRTNTVLVTAPADTLQVIERIIKLLDANSATGSDMKVFQLQFADASSAAKLVSLIFPPNPAVAAAKGAPGVIDPAHHSMGVNAAADDRTNTLVVTAPPDVLMSVDALVRQLDANPTSEQTFFMYRLRNGQAQNLALVLNQLFGSNQSTGGTPQTSRNGSSLLASQQSGRAGTFSGLGGGRNSGSSLTGTGSGGTGIGARRGTQTLGSGSLLSSSSISASLARSASDLMGQVFLVADLDTNSLLVTTASKYERQVRQIISELDRPVPQVLIKVLVAEVSHDNSADFGLDFSILNRRANGNGQTFGSNLGNAAQGSGLVVNFVENNLNVTLHALAQQGKLDVLSRPYILGSDNQPASITVGQEVPFITDSRITELGQTINTIQYQDVGIILNVTPHINPDGLVILDVAPEISQLTGSTVPISEQVSAPVIAKRSAQSRVGIKDGQTIVIGGLMEDRKSTTINKIPILGDIPLLGYIFRRTQVTKTKTELLIFLTPHVAREPDNLNPMSQDELRGTKLTPHAVEPGTFDEHLRGLRRGAAPPALPMSQPSPAVEFGPMLEPTTQRSDTSSEPIHLPAH